MKKKAKQLEEAQAKNAEIGGAGPNMRWQVG